MVLNHMKLVKYTKEADHDASDINPLAVKEEERYKEKEREERKREREMKR